MNNKNIELITIVSSIINVSISDLDMNSGPATQSTWDSLAHVTIIAAVEEIYGINLTMAEILSIKTLRDLEQSIDQHIQQK